MNMSELAAKSEMMLMGYVIPVSKEEVVFATQYILEVLHCNSDDSQEYHLRLLAEAEKVGKRIYKYDKEGSYNVKYMVVNTTALDRAVQITYIIEAKDGELSENEWRVPDNVNDLAGHDYFSYVYNVTYPELSEMGYTYYEKLEDNRVHRVG